MSSQGNKKGSVMRRMLLMYSNPILFVIVHRNAALFMVVTWDIPTSFPMVDPINIPICRL